MIAQGKIFVNSEVRVSAHFYNDSDSDVDPTTITFKTMSPSGVQTSYVYGTDDEVTRVNLGDYTADVTPDETGRWDYRWEATGSGTTLALEGFFYVQYSQFYDAATRRYNV